MKRTRLRFLRTLAWVMPSIVLLILLGFVLTEKKSYSEIENRKLQTFPRLTWNTVTSGRFESRFEDYVADQFPLRSTWIQIKSGADRLLGRTEANGIFLADDGYLIRNFVEPGEDSYARTMGAIQSFAAAYPSIHQYVLVAPSALSVYSDKLPANAIVGDESGYIGRLKADIEACGMRFIDLREEFVYASAGEQLYYRTDHHWTTCAAQLAYLRFADAAGLTEGTKTQYAPLLMTDSFSGTLSASSGFRLSETDEIYAYIPDSSVNCVVSYAGTPGKFPSFYWTENLGIRDKYTLFLNGNHPEIKIETGAQSKRALLLIKDSYANCFIPFLVQDFKRIVVVDPRYFTDELETLIAAEGITDVLFLYNAATLSTDTALSDDLKG